MPTKYSPEKISDPRIPATKILDPQSTHEKKIRIHNVPTRKTFGPIKYAQEKISDSRNTRKKKFWTHDGKMARSHGIHETHDGTIPTEFSILPMYLLACTQKMSTDLRSKIPTISPNISLRVPTFASQTRWHIQQIIVWLGLHLAVVLPRGLLRSEKLQSHLHRFVYQ